MKPNKDILLLLLVLILSACLSCPAEADILKKSSQIVNLVAVSDASGIIPLSSFQQVMPDGTLKPFTLPASQVLLITMVDFVIATSQDVPVAQFQLDPFYSQKFTIAGGFGNQTAKIKSGFPLGKMSHKFMARVISISNNSTIPGILECRLLGILAPKWVLAVPLNLFFED